MKIYKVSFRDNMGEHKGYEYFSSSKEAKRVWKEYREMADIETIDVTPTKKGIISALNNNASHPDNG
jgi:hypothetical protein